MKPFTKSRGFLLKKHTLAAILTSIGAVCSSGYWSLATAEEPREVGVFLFHHIYSTHAVPAPKPQKTFCPELQILLQRSIRAYGGSATFGNLASDLYSYVPGLKEVAPIVGARAAMINRIIHFNLHHTDSVCWWNRQKYVWQEKSTAPAYNEAKAEEVARTVCARRHFFSALIMTSFAQPIW